MEQKKLETKVSNECACFMEKCDILDFMKFVGVNVLHPGGFKAYVQIP